jgi:ABC-type lipoprotein export system ATPase subunit
MKESKCYKLIKHYGADHNESVVAVSHEMEKLHKALKVVNVKGWEVLSEDQLEWGHQKESNYFAITSVTYL